MKKLTECYDDIYKIYKYYFIKKHVPKKICIEHSVKRFCSQVF